MRQRPDFVDGDKRLGIHFVDEGADGGDELAGDGAVDDGDGAVFALSHDLGGGVAVLAQGGGNGRAAGGGVDAEHGEADGQPLFGQHAQDDAGAKAAGVANDLNGGKLAAQHGADRQDEHRGLDGADGAGFEQWSVLETMTPNEYLTFRPTLGLDRMAEYFGILGQMQSDVLALQNAAMEGDAQGADHWFMHLKQDCILCHSRFRPAGD